MRALPPIPPPELGGGGSNSAAVGRNRGGSRGGSLWRKEWRREMEEGDDKRKRGSEKKERLNGGHRLSHHRW